MNKVALYISFILVNCFAFGQNTRQTDSLEKLIAATGIDSVKAKAEIQLVFLYHTTHPEKAISLATDALKIGTTLNHKRIQAASYLGISYAKYFSGDYLGAAENCIRSAEICKSANDKKGEASAYTQLGNIYNRQKNFNKAIENYNESIKLKE